MGRRSGGGGFGQRARGNDGAREVLSGPSDDAMGLELQIDGSRDVSCGKISLSCLFSCL